MDVLEEESEIQVTQQKTEVMMDLESENEEAAETIQEKGPSIHSSIF